MCARPARRPPSAPPPRPVETPATACRWRRASAHRRPFLTSAGEPRVGDRACRNARRCRRGPGPPEANMQRHHPALRETDEQQVDIPKPCRASSASRKASRNDAAVRTPFMPYRGEIADVTYMEPNGAMSNGPARAARRCTPQAAPSGERGQGLIRSLPSRRRCSSTISCFGAPPDLGGTEGPLTSRCPSPFVPRRVTYARRIGSGKPRRARVVRPTADTNCSRGKKSPTLTRSAFVSPPSPSRREKHECRGVMRALSPRWRGSGWRGDAASRSRSAQAADEGQIVRLVDPGRAGRAGSGSR